MSSDVSAASENDVFMVPAYVELSLPADSEPISRSVNRNRGPLHGKSVLSRKEGLSLKGVSGILNGSRTMQGCRSKAHGPR